MFAQQRYAKINQVICQLTCHAGFLSVVCQADLCACLLLLNCIVSANSARHAHFCFHHWLFVVKWVQ